MPGTLKADEMKSGSMPTRHACFTGMVLFLAVIFHHALMLVGRLSFSVDQYSHILLVVPVSVALLYLTRNKVFAQVSYSLWAGLVLLALLGTFAEIAVHSKALEPSAYLSLSVLLFVVSLLAAFVICYGKTAFRAAAFPLLFLILAVPLPDAALMRVVETLQNGSALTACFLFRMAHIPYVRHGFILQLPRVDIYIAEECSGIRSSMVLLLCGLVLGHLYLKLARAQLILAILVLPVMVAKNGLRIFVLSTLGMYVDPSFLSGRLHHQGGFIFFGLAFLSLFALIWILRKLGIDSDPAFSGKPPALRPTPLRD